MRNGERVQPIRLPVTVREDNIYNDSVGILEKIRPDWFESVNGGGEPVHGPIQMRVFSGGITNKLVGFYLNRDKDDTVIVKMYGEKTEMFIDRSEEIKTMQLLHDRKCGPILYAVFENGIAYEYSPGNILDGTSCRANNVYPLVAKEMAKMHSIPLSPSDYERGSSIWNIMENFYKLSLEAMDLKPHVKSRLEKIGISPDWGRTGIDELERLCAQEHMPLGFCHNDLLLGNIVHDDKNASVAFIDFEYAATNYVAYDIANHFNEFAGIDEVDFSLFPGEQFQRDWIQEYLKYYTIGDGGSPSDADTFYYWVHLCIPISHLMWILWASVQACYSSIDFDFANYCGLRLPEYEKSLEAARIKSQSRQSSAK